MIVDDDGLVTPIVGPWAEEKYRLVECYARIFATAMKRRWDVRVYIDLFAGAGHARVREGRRIVDTAAVRVLSIPDPFDRYIFCELDSEKLAALQSRAAKASRGQAVFLNIDSNAEVRRVIDEIPPFGRDRKVLTFCFVDPFMTAHLVFDTIRRLASRFVDFLVLIPTGMDPGRNESPYSEADNRVIERFTGRAGWREERRHDARRPFGDFVALEFGRTMTDLDYLPVDLTAMPEVKNSRNRGLYRLAMFTRHPLGIDFWETCRQSTEDQKRLFR